jgi:hypothetical protein
MQLCSGLFSDHILPRRYHALFCENMLLAPSHLGLLGRSPLLTHRVSCLLAAGWVAVAACLPP